MDKDRIQGCAKQVVGGVKEVVGKVLGDQKTEAAWEGREGRGQNTDCRRQHKGYGAGDRQKVNRVAAFTAASGGGGGFGCRAADAVMA